MANLCEINIMLKGSRENIKKILDGIEQKTPELWIGRGAELRYTEDDIEDDEDGSCLITCGWCKGSLKSAFHSFAIMMEKQRLTGEGNISWDENIAAVKKFMTIEEACRAYNVNIEAFSAEPGCEFAEHVKIENGRVLLWDCIKYHEEYDEETDEYVTSGGYGDDIEYNLEYPKTA